MQDYCNFLLGVLLTIFFIEIAHAQVVEREIPLGEGMVEYYEKKDDRSKLIVEYEVPQTTYQKDIFVELLLNNQGVNPSIACGSLGRLKSRRGSLKIEVDRRKLGDLSSIELRISKIYEKRPPAQKWAMGSLLRPSWGHKQVDKSLGIPPEKRKKKIITPIIFGLLSIAALSEMNSMAEYKKAKDNSDGGDFEAYTQRYNQANNWRRTAIVLGGTAIVLDIGNAIAIYRKGKKQLKKYKKDYPNGNKCAKF